MTAKLVPALLCTSLLLACGSAPDPATAVPAPTDGSEMAAEGPTPAPAQPSTLERPQAPDLQHHMQRSFWLAVDIRNAVIAGDFASAERDARALVAQDYSGLPADWKPWIGEMQRHAQELTLTGGIDGAAQSVAGLAQACGNCHWRMQRGPRAEPTIDPDVDYDAADPIDARMLRHELGADELWRGLALPSEESWRMGARILTRAPMKPPIQDGTPVIPEMASQIERVRVLAKEARLAPSHDDRRHVYGELIATCARCHTVAGVTYR